MKGYVTNLDREAMGNRDFRRVLYSGPNLQLVLMTLQPGEGIGMEMHDGHDQFIRVEDGTGMVVLDGRETPLTAGSAVVIPANVEHNVINTSTSDPLRLYTLYAPPEHPEGTVHPAKRDAEAAQAGNE
jgi:mannose-6-phosphate isomerase-like protein (cupin superfamily)